jgi:hypothetical protein
LYFILPIWRASIIIYLFCTNSAYLPGILWEKVKRRFLYG